jgi:hypothetical protein
MPGPNSMGEDPIAPTSWIGKLLLNYLKLTILTLFLLGVVLTLFSFGRRNSSGAYFLVFEIGRAILVAAIVGGAVNFYLARLGGTRSQRQIESSLESIDYQLADHDKRIMGKLDVFVDSLGAMTGAGIARIYESRSAAVTDIGRDITDAKVQKLRILGIALNEFFLPGGQLHHEWEKVIEHVRSDGIGAQDVRILLIDPRCHGARMRSLAQVQKTHDPEGLKSDVEQAIKTLGKMSETTAKVKARLYRTAPILWLVQTDQITYLEQYYFWPKAEPTLNVPVLRFQDDATSERQPESMHKQLEEHFDFVWDYCSIDIEEYLDKAVIGCDEAIAAAGIGNIYYDRTLARKRLLTLMKNTRDVLYIKGVTLHSFLEDGSNLKAELCQAIERGVDTRLLLIDPDSEEAKIRAFREHRIQYESAAWGAFAEGDEYRDQVLYREVKAGIQRARQMTSKFAGKELDTRLYTSGPECFMLLTDDAVVVEQYHYGKIALESARFILGGEVPIIEYENREKDRPETESGRLLDEPAENVYGLFRDHFDFVFENFVKNI